MDDSGLGLVIDSSSVTGLNTELDKTVTSAGAAGDSVDRFTDKMNKAADAEARYLDQARRRAQTMVNTQLVVPDRGADIAAYGAQLDALKAKYNPLWAAGKKYKETLDEINLSVRTGAISEKEGTSAIQATKDAFAQQVVSLNSSADAHGRLSNQGMALQHAMRSAFEQVMLGVSPTTILTQQLNHLSYAASGPGGISAAFGEVVDTGKSLISWAASFITPLRVVIGGVSSLALGAVMLQSRWADAERGVKLSLTGIGSAQGVTLQQIEDISAATSRASNMSRTEAMTFSANLASSGTLTTKQIQQITDRGHDMSVTFGEDGEKLSKQLASMFTDPQKAATELNARLGFLDDTTLMLVRSLSQQGDKQRANQVIIDRFIPSIANAKDVTSAWAQTWNLVSNYASSAGAAVGKALSAGTDEEKLAEMQDRLQRLQDRKNTGFTTTPGGGAWGGPVRGRNNATTNSQITDLTKSIGELEAKLKAAAAAADDKKYSQLSISAGELARAIEPSNTELQRMKDQLVELGTAMNDPRIAKHIQDMKGVTQAYEGTAEAIRSFLAPYDRQIALDAQSIRALDERSPKARAEIAYQQKMIELSGQAGRQYSLEQKQALARNAATVASGGQTAQINLMQQRISILGDLATREDRELQVSNQVKLARMEGVRVSTAEEAALKRLAVTQYESSRLQQRVSMGLASESEIRAQLARELQSLIDKKLLDPKNMMQMADATAVFTKRLEDMRDQVAIARSPLEQLKRYELDATSLRKGLDTFATSTMNNVENSLVDAASGTKTFSAAFSDMTNSILKDVLRLTIRQSITGPLAGSLQSFLGSYFTPAAAGGSGLYATQSAAAVKFHRGGVVGKGGEPIQVPQSLFTDAPRYAIGGAAGFKPGEVPMVGHVGEIIGWPNQLAAAFGGGGGNSVQIHNYGPSQPQTKRRSDGGLNVIIPALEDAMAARAARNRGSLSKTINANQNGRNLKG